MIAAAMTELVITSILLSDSVMNIMFIYYDGTLTTSTNLLPVASFLKG